MTARVAVLGTSDFGGAEPAGILDDLSRLGRSETEALQASGAADGDQGVDLYVRLALIEWLQAGRGAPSLDLVRRASGHPLQPELLLACAITAGDNTILEEAKSAADIALQGEAREAMFCRIAEAWLYRFGDPARAAAVASEAAVLPTGEETAGELRYLGHVALGVAQNWRELGARLIEKATADGGSMPVIAEALHILYDRLGDSDGASRLVERVAAALSAPPGADKSGAIHHYRALLIAIEIASAYPGRISLGKTGLSKAALALLSSQKDAEVEGAAVRYLLAYELAQEDRAAALAALDPLVKADGAWGGRLAGLTQYQLATQTGDWSRAAAALKFLSADQSSGIAAAYAWRAAEITDARLGDAPAALSLWRQAMASPAAEQAQRAIERMLINESPGALVAHLKALGSSVGAIRSAALRRAAAVAESRANNIDQAIALQTLATEGAAMGENKPLMRLYASKLDREPLAEILRILSGSAGDARESAALLCVLGALQASMDKRAEAEKSLRIAANQAPLDPFARVAMAMILRRNQKPRELAAILTELAEMLSDEASRCNVLRELGTLQVRVLKDRRRARETLEQLLALQPKDPVALRSMAELHEDAREWAQAISLRERAIEALRGIPGREVECGGLYMEIGTIEEERRRDNKAALRAYEAAFACDESVASLQAQARVLRRMDREDLLLDVLRAELARNPDQGRQVEIQLEIAKLSAAEDETDSDTALQSYLRALEVDPNSSTALAAILAIGRAEGRWEVVAKAYKEAAQTAENLAIVAEAAQAQDDWPTFVQARTKELALVQTDALRASIVHELGHVYYRSLGQVDAAIESFRRSIAYGGPGGDVETAYRELSRILSEHERWAELAELYTQELATLGGTQPERELMVLSRLAALRRDRLAQPEEAAALFERILERHPTDANAVTALQELYRQLGREEDLYRILERESRAETVGGAAERSQMSLRLAQMKQSRGDLDGAMEAYKQAFEAQPSDRAVFTSMEKLCYEKERWDGAMWLYETAIKAVESGSCRAYRLGDLYARRGQVEVQYLKRIDEGAASYARVIELDPQNDTAMRFLESIYSQKGAWEALLAVYEKRAEMLQDEARRVDTLRRAARVATSKLKDVNEAARMYEKLLDADPANDEALKALERYYEHSDDWEKLVGVLERRAETLPAGEGAIKLLRRIAKICEEKLRDPKRASKHYRRILDFKSGHKEALDALGRIYESTEQWTDFIDITRKQIRVTSDHNVKALLYFKCGSVMEAKFGKEEDAIRYYDAAIKTSPSCLPAVHGLRDLYRRRQDWARVIQTLELEVKLWQDDKERAGVFAQIGRIYAENLDKPDRALHYYESALTVDPDCVPANKAMFEYYFDRQNWAQAQPLAQSLAQKVVREGDPSARSEFYRKCGIVSRMTGDPRGGAETLLVALEIKPTNLEALDALVDLTKAHPNVYEDLDNAYRELEKIYRKRDDAQPHLARVRVAQAVLREREGEIEEAEKYCSEAVELCPNDFAVLSALVDLFIQFRRWTPAVDAIVRFIEQTPPPPEPVRLQALLRQAEIHADYEMDSHRAIAVLRDMIRQWPTNEEAHYRLAQEQFVLGRYDEALALIERVIELAAAPGAELSPEALARYYYYRGLIIEAGGDSRRATSQYRRAIEYDPGYAPPAVALAKRAASGGDQRQAETMLITAAHAAISRGGNEAAVPLQRGLARILLASGDRTAAIEAYRGILNVQPDGAPDRVALAEIYAMEDVHKAINELKKVINRDIHHAPAYRMLAALYLRIGETERAIRALSVMDMLGFGEDSDRATVAKARDSVSHNPLRRSLTDELRAQLMLTEAATGPVGELFTASAREITALFPKPNFGENLQPLAQLGDPVLEACLADVVRLHGIQPEVYIGDRVPGEVALMAYPQRAVVINRALLSEADGARRYLFSWAFDAIRGGYAILYHLGRRQRSELGSLLQSLLLPESERSGPTNDFISTLPKAAAKVIERHQGQGYELDIDVWIEGMTAVAKRAGLFASDDFGAATRMIARINGENPNSKEDIIALGAVMGGPDLVRFYLADEYHRLREALCSPNPPPAT